MTHPQSITLACDGSETVMSTLGAEALCWSVGGRQLLWTPDPAIWDRTSPILFPTVGWCRDGRTRIGERHYPMPVHGFAAGQTFTIEQHEADTAVFLLRDNASTHLHFPFRFAFRVAYRLSRNDLAMQLSVVNEGGEPMPYAFGVHPGFAMPFAGGKPDDYRIVFEQPENPDVPVIAPGGLFSPERRRTPLRGSILPLDRSIFAQEAMCFLDSRSRSLSLSRPGHGRITVHAGTLPHLAIWSMPGASFVCLEAWSSHGDPLEFDGELHEKPGMRVLAPGAEASCRVAFHWQAA